MQWGLRVRKRRCFSCAPLHVQPQHTCAPVGPAHQGLGSPALRVRSRKGSVVQASPKFGRAECRAKAEVIIPSPAGARPVP